VGSKNGHRLRRVLADGCDLVALSLSGTHFRERAAAFPKRLCATASASRRKLVAIVAGVYAPADLRLSVQRALVGQVSPNLYGACIDLRHKQVVLTFYVAPDLSDDERDDLYAAGASGIGDCPDDHRIEERFVEIASDATPLTTVGTWVFLQRGFQTSGL
jgi:hypothetical protein